MRGGINGSGRSGRIRRSGQPRSGEGFTDLHSGKVRDGRTGKILSMWASFEGSTIQKTDSTPQTAGTIENGG
jgi:hypothetical protein